MKAKAFILFISLLAACIYPAAGWTISHKFDFYSDSVEISFDTSLFVSFQEPVSDHSVTSFYEQLNKSQHEPVIKQLLTYRQKHNLNDWFYYQLVRKVAESIAPKKENYERYTLYKWFLMGKSGYDVTLAHSEKHLLFYVRTFENIYDIPYFTRNDQQYICLNYHDYGKINFKKNRIFEIKLNIPEGVRAFSYKVNQVPNFRPESYTEKNINFEYQQKNYHFRIKVNPQIQNIFQNYPVVDYDSYFNIPLSKETYASLIPALKEQLAGINTNEGVDYLMHFTRDAFIYANDQDNFGKEKRLSPEQTLLYSSSDCDDRAAFFFFLVREIYNLPMIALLYPTHITIAVQLEQEVGKPVMYKGNKYYICEPTPQYADLPVGQSTGSHHKSPYLVVFEYTPTLTTE